MDIKEKVTMSKNTWDLPAGNYRNLASAENYSTSFRDRNHSHSDIFGTTGKYADIMISSECSRKEPARAFSPRLEIISPRARRQAELQADSVCFPPPESRNVPLEDVEEPEPQYPLNMMLDKKSRCSSPLPIVKPTDQNDFGEEKMSDLFDGEKLNDTARGRRIMQDKSHVFQNSPTINAAYGKCVSALQEKSRQDETSLRESRIRNPMFSNLFGRSTPDYPASEHDDTNATAWSKLWECENKNSDDCRLSYDSQSLASMTPRERHLTELKSHLPLPLPKLSSIENKELMEDSYDTSARLKDAVSGGHKEIHQAHMQSTLLGTDFYLKAKQIKPSETVQIQLSRLRSTVTENDLIQFIRRCGCHLTQLKLDMDPLNHKCKGKASILIRNHNGAGGIIYFGESLAADDINVEITDLWNPHA
ncbi:hypothetical protein IE077_002950 [Cardiosporidium cionae]|uniref:Uncharacterized protein n=1 Tax=Cardiosporidium cionae TaxID=476202 RepID=A0ABQ7JFE0_9APIC|nr:hypothetical protein IE077_002950 [Cardiosporidium cionae]|eukprot:KAF8822714.1 hypothetical protein IE077_002950 [Cardiosporidium cionae]